MALSADQIQAALQKAQGLEKYGLRSIISIPEQDYHQTWMPVVELNCLYSRTPHEIDLAYLGQESTALRLLEAHEVDPSAREPNNPVVCLKGFKTWRFVLNAHGVWTAAQTADVVPTVDHTLVDLIEQMCTHPECESLFFDPPPN